MALALLRTLQTNKYGMGEESSPFFPNLFFVWNSHFFSSSTISIMTIMTMINLIFQFQFTYITYVLLSFYSSHITQNKV
eukprot:UN08007